MKRLVILAVITFLFVSAWAYGQGQQSLFPLAAATAEDPNDVNETVDPNEVVDPDETIDPEEEGEHEEDDDPEEVEDPGE